MSPEGSRVREGTLAEMLSVDTDRGRAYPSPLWRYIKLLTMNKGGTPSEGTPPLDEACLGSLSVWPDLSGQLD